MPGSRLFHNVITTKLMSESMAAAPNGMKITALYKMDFMFVILTFL